MLKQEYSLQIAQLIDVDLWMGMIEIIKDNFPGLKTKEELSGYRTTVIKNIKRETALCVKHDSEIVGVLLFSYNAQCLGCMAVHPHHRRNGMASAMVKQMLDLFPIDMDISVSTFRKNDELGNAPRALYKKFGFIEKELTIEFGYPHQKFLLKRS